MKKKYFLLAILLVFNWNVQAQFQGDFENCEVIGEPPPGGSFPWTNWGCGGGAGCDIVCSQENAQSGIWSGLIPGDGTTDAVLDLGNQIFGEWCLSFWMYVPSNKVAYWNLQGSVPIGAGEWIVGNVYFNQDNANPGVGLIDDAVGAPINFAFPHDQWFSVRMEWDITAGISLATWYMYVDGFEVIPAGTAFTSADGTIPTSLGGINFFSISSDNELYVDDFYFRNEICDPIFDVEDLSKKEFNLYPNPTKGVINLEAQEPIERIRIYNLLGSLLKEVSGASTIDVSSIKAGLYLIEVSTARGKSIQKFIKE